MRTTILVAALLFEITSGSAIPWNGWNGKPYTCNNFDLTVNVENVPTVVSPLPPLTNQLVATSVLNALAGRTQSSTSPPLTNLTASYTIAAELCSPNEGATSSTLQILSHGIGFNRSYWDFYPSKNHSDTQYSYIAAATAAGYSTFSYNRLGIAGSTLADPITEVQDTVELAILAELTTLAKAGGLPGQNSAPSSIVHVGHSYGSILTNALVAAYPDLSDGIVLTGYSHLFNYEVSFLINSNLLIANLADPTRFPPALYKNEYGTWPSKWANQYSFFGYPDFDPDVLTDAENTKQPFALGEFLAMALLGNLTAPGFTKPVLYVNGEKDLIFCASNCTGLIEEGSPAYQAFENADVESTIVAGSGHGLNLHLNADKKVYGVITDWLARHGL